MMTQLCHTFHFSVSWTLVNMLSLFFTFMCYLICYIKGCWFLTFTMFLGDAHKMRPAFLKCLFLFTAAHTRVFQFTFHPPLWYLVLKEESFTLVASGCHTCARHKSW